MAEETTQLVSQISKANNEAAKYRRRARDLRALRDETQKKLDQHLAATAALRTELEQLKNQSRVAPESRPKKSSGFAASSAIAITGKSSKGSRERCTSSRRTRRPLANERLQGQLRPGR